jgi:hypothetical protein
MFKLALIGLLFSNTLWAANMLDNPDAIANHGDRENTPVAGVVIREHRETGKSEILFLDKKPSKIISAAQAQNLLESQKTATFSPLKRGKQAPPNLLETEGTAESWYYVPFIRNYFATYYTFSFNYWGNYWGYSWGYYNYYWWW